MLTYPQLLEVDLAVPALDEALTLTAANTAVNVAFTPLALPWFLRDHGLGFAQR